MADTSGYQPKPQPEWGIKLSKYIFIPQRHVMTFMGFFAMVNGYATRICLSMVMPALVVPRNYTEELAIGSHCPASENLFKDDEKPTTGIYDWSQSTQGLVLSCFYIGYVITQIPGGELAKEYGSKWVINLSIMINTVGSILTPMTIDYTEHTGLIIIRVIMGFAQGTLYPAFSTLIGQWVPINERTSIGTIIFSGTQIGTIVGNILTGFLIAHWGWRAVFYVLGICGLLWCVFFTFLCFSDPASHPYIKPKEKEYLMQEMGSIARRRDLGMTPWKEIFTSIPVYMTIIAAIGHDWAYFVMVTDLPKYFNDVMQIPIKKNALFASLPFAMMFVSSVIVSYIADFVIKYQYLTVTKVRKILTGLSAIFASALAMSASYGGCNELLVMTCFILCMTFMGLFYPGARLSPIDLSPNNAGTLMAITNAISSLTGFLAPYLVGVMTPNTTIREWRSVFCLASTIVFVSALMYCIWGTSDPQPWNEPKKKDKE